MMIADLSKNFYVHHYIHAGILASVHHNVHHDILCHASVHHDLHYYLHNHSLWRRLVGWWDIPIIPTLQWLRKKDANSKELDNNEDGGLID